MSDRIRCACRRCTIRGLMGPAILITVGVLFLLDQMRGGYFSFGNTFPVILIVIGAISLASSLAPMDGHVSAGNVEAYARDRDIVFVGHDASDRVGIAEMAISTEDALDGAADAHGTFHLREGFGFVVAVDFQGHHEPKAKGESVRETIARSIEHLDTVSKRSEHLSNKIERIARAADKR